jgi:hypothetical protein
VDYLNLLASAALGVFEAIHASIVFDLLSLVLLERISGGFLVAVMA